MNSERKATDPYIQNYNNGSSLYNMGWLLKQFPTNTKIYNTYNNIIVLGNEKSIEIYCLNNTNELEKVTNPINEEFVTVSNDKYIITKDANFKLNIYDLSKINTNKIDNIKSIAVNKNLIDGILKRDLEDAYNRIYFINENKNNTVPCLNFESEYKNKYFTSKTGDGKEILYEKNGYDIRVILPKPYDKILAFSDYKDYPLFYVEDKKQNYCIRYLVNKDGKRISYTEETCYGNENILLDRNKIVIQIPSEKRYITNAIVKNNYDYKQKTEFSKSSTTIYDISNILEINDECLGLPIIHKWSDSKNDYSRTCVVKLENVQYNADSLVIPGLYTGVDSIIDNKAIIYNEVDGNKLYGIYNIESREEELKPSNTLAETKEYMKNNKGRVLRK